MKKFFFEILKIFILCPNQPILEIPGLKFYFSDKNDRYHKKSSKMFNKNPELLISQKLERKFFFPKFISFSNQAIFEIPGLKFQIFDKNIHYHNK